MGEKKLPGIFLGYEQHAGGGWSEDVWILDWENVENAETVSDITPKRFKFPEVHAWHVEGHTIGPFDGGVDQNP